MRTFPFGPERRALGRIGLGTWPFDGRDWGETDDDEAVRTVHAALGLGIDLFDTAPVYGPERCEKVLGRALSGVPRDEVFVATKVGVRWNAVHLYQDLSAASVQEECEASLRRLGMDHVDLLQIHWPHHVTPLEETLGAMVALVEQGKVRHVGVSNFDVPLLEQAAAAAPIASLQPPYHLFMRGIEAEILPWCGRRGVPALVYGPLCKGLLTGKFLDRPIPDDIRRKDPFFGDEVLPALLDVVRELAGIAHAAGLTPGQLALAYALARPGIACVLVGARTPAQIAESAAAAGVDLAPDVLTAVDSALARAPRVV
jgi:aryl-alcohol dehydrogenase-like predicted oxidoreductase